MKQIYLFVLCGLMFLSGCAPETCETNIIGILNPNETSAQLLMDYAKTRVCKSTLDDKAPLPSELDEQKLILVYDLYVKARSYAILNKIFFILSIIFAIIVFIWPSLGVVLSSQQTDQPWYKSAIVQTTVTGIAALMFAVYSQYKDKQTFTENLMRYAVFSEQPATELIPKMIEEIGKIDNGFSFTTVTNDKTKKE